MVMSQNKIKLIDFGLSKACKDPKALLHEIAGTPYYMAPEMLNGTYDFKADMWSVGVILYTLVSGYLPFQGVD